MAKQPSILITKRKLERAVVVLKAVAHPIRLQIVNILLKGELSVGDLIKKMGTKQSLTSQQLTNLKLSGILKSKRSGNRVYYSLANKTIINIMEAIIKEL